MSRNICLLVLLANLSFTVPALAAGSDVALVLRTIDGDTARLSIATNDRMETFEFTKEGGLWTKEGNIPLARELGIRDAPSDLAMTLKLSPTAKQDWPQFWNVLIDALHNPKQQLVTYTKSNGASGSARLLRIAESDWELPIGDPREPTSKPQQLPAWRLTEYGHPNPSTPTTFSLFAPYWLGIIIILALVIYLLRSKLIAFSQKALLQMAHRAGKVPAGQISLDELLLRLHQRVQERPSWQDLPEADKSLRAAALEYVDKEYKLAAKDIPPVWIMPAIDDAFPAKGAGGTEPQGQDDAKRSERAPSKKEKQNEALAGLGEFTLQLCRRRTKIPDLQAVQTFLESELKRLDDMADQTEQLANLTQQSARLQNEKNQLAEKAKHLEAEKEQLAKDKVGLSGQMSRQQRKLEETEQKLKDTDASLEKMRTTHNQIKTQGDNQLAAEQERSRKSLQEKEQAFRSIKTGLETARDQAVAQVKQLEGELATVRGEKVKMETLTRTLETSLETEKELNIDIKKRQKVLDDRLMRVLQANTFLGKVHKAYWDRCKHPSSMGAILYHSYLGLFQAALGAGKEDPELEATGWSNLMNLLRRISQVPGLDHFQKEFGPRVYPEIESIQLQRTVDNNRPDSERFVHSSVLQALLSGEVQIDGDQRARFSLDRLRGWPLYFRVDQSGVWGAM